MQNPGQSPGEHHRDQDAPDDNSANSTHPKLPRVFLKLPTMPSATNGAPLRRSTRRSSGSLGMPSGSEYHQSDHSMEVHDEDAVGEIDEDLPEEKPIIEYALTQRGRKITKKTYAETPSEDETGSRDPADLFNDDEGLDAAPAPPPRRTSNHHKYIDDDDDDEDLQPRRPTKSSKQMNDFIVDDEIPRYTTRNRLKKKQSANAKPPGGLTRLPGKLPQPGSKASRSKRAQERNAKRSANDPGAADYVQDTSSGSVDADEDIDDDVHTSEVEHDGGGEADVEAEHEQEPEDDGKPYALRRRVKINYAIPPPLEDLPRPPPAKGRSGGGRTGWGGGGGRAGKGRSLGWSATGAELGRWMGMGNDDSVRPASSNP